MLFGFRVYQTFETLPQPTPRATLFAAMTVLNQVVAMLLHHTRLHIAVYLPNCKQELRQKWHVQLYAWLDRFVDDEGEEKQRVVDGKADR